MKLLKVISILVLINLASTIWINAKEDTKTLKPKGEWTWLSFPVLNPDSCSVMTGFITELMDTNILDEIVWTDSMGKQSIYWMGQGYVNLYYPFSSTQGYKFKSYDLLEDPVKFKIEGNLASPYTEIHLKGENVENWIGYFLEDSQAPLDALAAIEDNLTYIATEDWTMLKVGGRWMGTGNRYTLNYGDMVILRCKNDCSFRWNDENPVEMKKKPVTKSFTFEKQSDYIPVYVYLEDDNKEMPSEIGFYVNNECMGAAVAESKEIQINAYVRGIENSDNVNFVTHFNNSEKEEIIRFYAVYENGVHEFVERKLEFRKNKKFYAIKINIR